MRWNPLACSGPHTKRISRLHVRCPGHHPEGRLIAFGFTNFENYRIRALLYAGKPNWRVLDSIVVE